MTSRVYGDCPYCDRPARASGACWAHEDLLAGEPDQLARALERAAELEQQLVENPLGRRNLRRRGGGGIIPRRTSTD